MEWVVVSLDLLQFWSWYGKKQIKEEIIYLGEQLKLSVGYLSRVGEPKLMGAAKTEHHARITAVLHPQHVFHSSPWFAGKCPIEFREFSIETSIFCRFFGSSIVRHQKMRRKSQGQSKYTTFYVICRQDKFTSQVVKSWFGCSTSGTTVSSLRGFCNIKAKWWYTKHNCLPHCLPGELHWDEHT